MENVPPEYSLRFSLRSRARPRGPSSLQNVARPLLSALKMTGRDQTAIDGEQPPKTWGVLVDSDALSVLDCICSPARPWRAMAQALDQEVIDRDL